MVLVRLIYLFPDDANWCYMMGLHYSNTSVEKSAVWFRLCHSKNPEHFDNLLALCRIMFKQGEHQNILDLNVNHVFDKFLHHNEFLYIFLKSSTTLFYYKNVIKHFTRLIQSVSNKPAITYDEKLSKFNNYYDIAMFYCMFGSHQTGLLHSKKAFELSEKFNLSIDKKLLSYQTLSMLYNYDYYDPNQMFSLALKINNFFPLEKTYPRSVSRDKNKIRIGYVSSDFSLHAVSNFIYPILKHHDRNKFDIYLYSNNEKKYDLYTKLNLPYELITNMPDHQVDRLIRSQNIDILIDLNGHTLGNRVSVFAKQPAPIQISYIGYPNTSGLKSMQYRFTDNVADPVVSKQKYSEELVRLPRCFLLYQNVHQPKPVVPKKTTDTIVFGALNKEFKNTNYCLSAWKQIMRNCPNTSIIFKMESYDNYEERYEYYMKELDIPRDRITVLGQMTSDVYYDLFSKIDILLDTFPYSGTTTTCNALYNSIPIVTLSHPDYHAHNVSASILSNAGLSEFVAKTQEEYVTIVKDLVEHPARIQTYKEEIHKKFLQSMNPALFMSSYETSLKDIYDKHAV
jgi:predicted O-linked N-acetylglucosamine transferase (SPINDLY family)